MPSKKYQSAFDEASLNAAIDAALLEVRSSLNVDLLHACRALFRKKVPFSMRSYVSASLLLRCVGGASPASGAQRRGAVAAKGSAAAAPRKTTEAEPGRGGRRAARAPGGDGPKPRDKRYEGETVVVFVNAGRRQRFNGRVAIDLLAQVPGVGEERLGNVRTMDNYSFIELAPEAEAAAIAALHGREFRGKPLVANRARKKGEPAEAATGVL